MALTGDNQKFLGKFLGPITRCIDFIKCCIADLLDSSNDQTALLEAILEAIQNIEFTLPEGTVFPTKDVLCTPDCQSVLCFTTFNPNGTVATITHVLPDGTEYPGDLNSLDPTCAKCSEPTPTFEIITKDICLEDCTEGCQVLKVNTLTEEITLVATLGQDGLPTELTVVPCPKIIVTESVKCITNDEGVGGGEDCSDFDTTYANANNTTDITMSSNDNNMKWELSSGANVPGSEAFTQAALDCIDAGGSATITNTDPDGNSYEFIATGYTGAVGSPILFSGSGITTGSGKIITAELVCSC